MIEQSNANNVNKSMSHLAGTENLYTRDDKNKRGLNVYSFTQTMPLAGRTKDGVIVTANYDVPFVGTSVQDRIDITRLCSPIFGVINGRAQKISAYKWRVVPKFEVEEKKSEYLQSLKDIYDEYKDSKDTKYVVARNNISREVSRYLTDVLPDLSNFNASLMRWYNKVKNEKKRSATEIEDWLSEPNQADKWSDFVKKWVFDYHVHGAVSIYKEILNGKLENFYALPGGTVFPLKNRYIGGYNAFAQVSGGLDIKIYFTDEISHVMYLPNTASAYGFLPIDALINKVAESLMFDKLMADQADGTKAPEKVVLFSKPSPFGDPSLNVEMPIEAKEQQRIETAFNEARKMAVKVLSGYGTPTVLDLSRENTMSIQMERQKMIREEVAMVFGATNMEVNLTGADNTSGRSTSDAQEAIEFNKGTLPILARFEDQMNKDIIPYRFGCDYKFEFIAGKNEMEEFKLYQLMLQSGLYSVNEIRTKKLNEKPINDPAFDKPQAPQGQQPPTGAPDDPMHVQQKTLQI